MSPSEQCCGRLLRIFPDRLPFQAQFRGQELRPHQNSQTELHDGKVVFDSEIEEVRR